MSVIGVPLSPPTIVSTGVGPITFEVSSTNNIPVNNVDVLPGDIILMFYNSGLTNLNTVNSLPPLAGTTTDNLGNSYTTNIYSIQEFLGSNKYYFAIWVVSYARVTAAGTLNNIIFSPNAPRANISSYGLYAVVRGSSNFDVITSQPNNVRFHTPSPPPGSVSFDLVSNTITPVSANTLVISIAAYCNTGFIAGSTPAYSNYSGFNIIENAGNVVAKSDPFSSVISSPTTFNPTFIYNGNGNAPPILDSSYVSAFAVSFMFTPLFAPSSATVSTPYGIAISNNNAPSTVPTNNPHISPTLGRNVSQIGAASKFGCGTRTLKNVRLIRQKSIANQIPPGTNTNFILEREESEAGDISIINIAGPANINRTNPQSGYGSNFFNTDANGTAIPAPNTQSYAPVFNGIVHIFQINYVNPSGQSFQVQTNDINTIQTFCQKAYPEIQSYTSQYGNTGLKVDPTIYTANFNINSSNQFNDQDLSGTPGANGAPNTPGLIDNLAVQYGWTGPIASSGAELQHAIMIVGAVGVVNTDAPLSSGVLGYHNASLVNGIPYIFFSLPQNGLTPSDTADAYQLVASHESAEMTVDPGANLANPEVCDPCGPNCEPVWRDFFDSNGNYISSSFIFPPVFTYSFFICGIIQPSYAGTTLAEECLTPPNACDYGPPNSSTNNLPFIPPLFNVQQLTGIPNILQLISGLPGPIIPSNTQISVITPGNIITANLVPGPLGTTIIKLPFKS